MFYCYKATRLSESQPGYLNQKGWDRQTIRLCRLGLVALMMLFVVGLFLSRGIDARWLIAAGLIIMGIGNYWMSQMNLDISSWQVVWPRCVVIGGLSMIFAPHNVAAFLYIPAPGCMAPPSVSLRCCATRAAASAPPSPKPFTSDATNYIVCTLGRTSTG